MDEVYLTNSVVLFEIENYVRASYDLKIIDLLLWIMSQKIRLSISAIAVIKLGSLLPLFKWMRNCSCPLLKRILDFSVAGVGSICPHIRFRMQFNYVTTFLASSEILHLFFDIRTEPFFINSGTNYFKRGRHLLLNLQTKAVGLKCSKALQSDKLTGFSNSKQYQLEKDTWI